VVARIRHVIPAHAGIQTEPTRHTGQARGPAPTGLAGLDAAVEHLGNEAGPLINTLLDPVRAALDDSADLMDFREKLSHQKMTCFTQRMIAPSSLPARCRPI